MRFKVRAKAYRGSSGQDRVPEELRVNTVTISGNCDKLLKFQGQIVVAKMV